MPIAVAESLNLGTEIRPVRKNTQIELDVEKLAFGGKAVARVDGFVIFLDHGVPGQRVLAQITRVKRQYAEGRVMDLLLQSPRFVDPFCTHFGVCGGCQWQDVRYDDQLLWKREHVHECLKHLAGVGGATVEPTIPSPLTLNYRNKMEFTFSNRRWLSPQEIASREVAYDKSLALGLHVKSFFDKVFNVDCCYLESPLSVEILKEVRQWCLTGGVPSYSTKDHQGFWRFLVIREAKKAEGVLVHLLTAFREGHEAIVDGLAGHLAERFPQITTFVHSVSRKKAQVAIGDSSRIVMGPGFIQENLGGLQFRISANSFFQTNPFATEKLYETIRRLGDFTGKETVWDLYCGTGSIALYISSQVRRVVGFEVLKEATDDAGVNCGLNGIDNCVFMDGDLKEVIKRAPESSYYGGVPDVVITDPPRAGMHPQVVKALLEILPKTIITVSCNPSTLARDLAFLLESYEIRCVQPFDLFPHTPHIECVVKLVKK